jgi:hypothetical protein
MKGYVTAGLATLAGVAIFEAALIPAVIVGGAAVLAPKYMPKPRWRMNLPQSSPARRRAQSATAVVDERRPNLRPGFSLTNLSGFELKQAIAKTITFRIIVTTLDFTTNYVVIGELTTAAGLSSFNLVAGSISRTKRPGTFLSHRKTLRSMSSFRIGGGQQRRNSRTVGVDLQSVAQSPRPSLSGPSPQ